MRNFHKILLLLKHYHAHNLHCHALHKYIYFFFDMTFHGKKETLFLFLAKNSSLFGSIKFFSS
jgi:hypothetical protein